MESFPDELQIAPGIIATKQQWQQLDEAINNNQPITQDDLNAIIPEVVQNMILLNVRLDTLIENCVRYNPTVAPDIIQLFAVSIDGALIELKRRITGLNDQQIREAAAAAAAEAAAAAAANNSRRGNAATRFQALFRGRKTRRNLKRAAAAAAEGALPAPPLLSPTPSANNPERARVSAINAPNVTLISRNAAPRNAAEEAEEAEEAAAEAEEAEEGAAAAAAVVAPLPSLPVRRGNRPPKTLGAAPALYVPTERNRNEFAWGMGVQGVGNLFSNNAENAAYAAAANSAAKRRAAEEAGVAKAAAKAAAKAKRNANFASRKWYGSYNPYKPTTLERKPEYSPPTAPTRRSNTSSWRGLFNPNRSTNKNISRKVSNMGYTNKKNTYKRAPKGRGWRGGSRKAR